MLLHSSRLADNARTVLLIGGLILVLSPATAKAQAPPDPNTSVRQPLIEQLKQRLHLSALSEARYALGTDGTSSQKLEFIIQPELEIELPLDLELTAIGRLRADAFDELEPDEPHQDAIDPISRRGFIGNQVDFELRELYLDGRIGRASFTLGKQQIVWGTADGLKVLDVVNPQSFREFILEDFDDSRIPQWAVNVEIPVKDVVVQLIWIPDQTYHELPEAGSLFAFTSPMIVPELPTGVIVNTRSLNKPGRVFKDSDAGIRLSTFWHGWDLTLNYLYQYDNAPVFFRTITLPKIPPLPLLPGPPPPGFVLPTIPPPVVTVAPGYERTHLIGGSFSNAFGDLTARGELAYATNRFVSTTDPMDKDGVVKTGEFSYVLGLDWSGISDTLVSAQLFQTYLTDNSPKLIRDDLDSNATLLVRREFMNASLIAELTLIQSLDDGDGIFRSKVSYELRSNVTVSAGFDFFYGIHEGIFGQFNRNDRVLFGVEWGL